MRGNEFIRGVMDFAETALRDADSAGFALGELIGQGFQPVETTPAAGTRAPQDTRTVGNVEVPLRERQEGETSMRPRPQNFEASGNAGPRPNDVTGRPDVSGPPNNLRMINGGATRNLPINEGLSANISNAIASVYGEGFEGRVYSGGQGRQGSGTARVGTVRHDNGRAADLYIYGPDGNRLTGDALAPLAQFWKANGLGGVGLEMRGGGVHLDDWTKPPPGGGMSWSYGNLTAAQRAALEAGARGELPPLVSEWAGAVVGDGNEPTAGNVYNALSSALVPTVSTSGSLSGAASAGGLVGGPAGSQQIEDLIGGIISDVYGDVSGDDQRAMAHKSSIWENLSVSLGQMAAGQPVNVSGVLRAQENQQRQIVEDRMNQNRMRAGAAAVLEGGGSPAMAQAVATGAVSYRDMLSERQIANAEVQLARENAQDDNRRSAMERALRDLGYTDEMIALGANDPTSFFKLDDIMTANDAAELAAERDRVRTEGRRAIMTDFFQSQDPVERRAATYMADNMDLSVADALKAAQEYRKRQDEEAQRARTAETEDLARRQTETQIMQAEQHFNEIRRRMQGDGEVTPVEREALRRYDLSGRSISPMDAEEQAREALTPDTKVVGSSLVRTDTFEPVFEAPKAESVGPTDVQVYNEGRAFAEAQGPEALAAFDAAYPRGALDYALERAGRLGGAATDGYSATGLPGPISVIDPDLPFTDTMGPRGAIANLANSASEIFSGQLRDPSNREANRALERLATRSVIDLAGAVAGRPSNYLLQLFEQLEVRPGRLTMGPESALIGMREQREIIARGIAENNQIIDGPFPASDKRDASAGNLKMQNLLADYDAIIGAMERDLPEPSGVSQRRDRGQDTSSQTAPMEFSTQEEVGEAIQRGDLRPGQRVTIDGRTFTVRTRE